MIGLSFGILGLGLIIVGCGYNIRAELARIADALERK